MNIVIKLVGFNGGAPRSLLEYAKILLKEGHIIYAVAAKGKAEVEQLYDSVGIETFYLESFTKLSADKNYAQIYKTSNKLKKIILSHKIDLIIPVGVMEIYYSSFVANSCGCNVVGVIPGGNTHTDFLTSHLMKKWRCNKIICFSKENEKSLIKNGVPKEEIYVIANRINLKGDDDWFNVYNRKINKIQCAVVSRLANGKIGGIEAAIETIRQLSLRGFPIELSIAGDGECKEALLDCVQDVNKSLGKEAVRMIGFVANPDEIYKASHIVFGKGRGAIEPLLLNRFVIVIAEDGKMELCTKETFRYLSEGNFGGRNISNSISIDEMAEMTENILENNISASDAKAVFQMAYQEYHIDGLKSKLLPIIGDDLRTYKKKFFLIFLGILYSLCAAAITKIKKIGGKNNDLY